MDGEGIIEWWFSHGHGGRGRRGLLQGPAPAPQWSAAISDMISNKKRREILVSQSMMEMQVFGVHQDLFPRTRGRGCCMA